MLIYLFKFTSEYSDAMLQMNFYFTNQMNFTGLESQSHAPVKYFFLELLLKENYKIQVQH
jgi:hypothetical protein